MSSRNIRFQQQRLKKKKVFAGRPRPKLSELTELILKFSFVLENTSAVIHISKKCATMSVFLCENCKNPLAGGSRAPSPLDSGGPPVLASFFAKSWVLH